MSNIQLPEHFFEDNPLAQFSTALVTHFQIVTVTMSELNDQMDEMVISGMEESRYEQYLAEKEHIMNLNKAEDIVSYMRKFKDPINRRPLIQRALEYQEDVMPLVMKKIRTSGHDVFIENKCQNGL